jgi:hypothetical protein
MNRDAQRQLNLFKGKRQRGIAPPPPLEFHLHCLVADTLRRWCLPNWQWTHIGHGELRSPTTAGRLKRMGVRPGWADFILLAPNKGGAHFLELKREGAKPSEQQAAFALYCGCEGYPHAFAHTYPEALAVLQSWGCVRTGITVSA